MNNKICEYVAQYTEPYFFSKPNDETLDEIHKEVQDSIANYLSNPSENEIDEGDMLSPREYHGLSDEEKKAYQYFEYTPTCGFRAIMRRFKQAVLDRIDVWNDMISWQGNNKRISLSDVRVLVLID